MTHSAAPAVTAANNTTPAETEPQKNQPGASAAATANAPENILQDVCVVEEKDAHAPVLIERPVAETREIELQPGKQYLFGFDKSSALSYVQKGDDLTITFDCGGILILKNYQHVITGSSAATFAFASEIPQGPLAGLVSIIKSDEVKEEPQGELRKSDASGETDAQTEPQALVQDAQRLANIKPAAGEETSDADMAKKLAQIEPAAGDAGAGGSRNSGYGFNSSFSATPVGPLNAVGPIAPTALRYNANFPQPEPFLQDEEPQDFSPEISPVVNAVDETALRAGALSVSGNIPVDFGGDAPGTLTPNGTFSAGGSLAGGSLASGGTAITVTPTLNGYTGVAGGTTVFTITIDSTTGTYVFTQFAPIDHADGLNPDDIISLVFGVTATDSDGDTSTTTITINVADDAPLAVAPMAEIIDEGALTGGPVSVSDTLTIDFGQDVPGTVDPNGSATASGDLAGGVLSAGGVAVTITPTATGYVGTAGGATVFEITVSNTGAYTFTLFQPLDHSNPGDTITLDFGVVVTDFDGDSTMSVISIAITDDVPVIAAPAIGSGIENIDETNLGPITVGGTLNVDFGTDTPGDVHPDGNFSSGGSLAGGNLTSGGVAVVVTQAANGYVGMAGATKVFEITINAATGAYSFTQFEVLDHADAANPNDVINLVFGVEVTDSDGDTDSGTITIHVADDAPSIAGDGIKTVDEDNLTPAVVNGNLTIDFGNDLPGAVAPNGSSSASGDLAGGNLTSNGVAVVITQTANGYEGTAGGTQVFTLAIDPATGAYTFTLLAPLDHSNPGDQIFLTFGATVTDFDGDTASTDIVIKVIDDVPTFGAPAIGSGIENVDETNLGPVIVNGALVVDSGSDTPSLVSTTGGFTTSVALTSGGAPVVIASTPVGYTGTANGVTIFTLDVNNAGAYTFTLLGVLDHPNAADPNDVITLGFGVKVTDADGDTANGSITINVLDDGPIAVDDGNFTNSTSAITGNVLTNDDVGADTPGAVSAVTFNGVTTAIAPGVTVTINGNFGVLHISSTGAYTYNATGGVDGTDQFTYTMHDFDGDTATAKLTINVDIDDIPILVQPEIVTVDETNLAPTTSVSDTVQANFFTDGPGTITGNGGFSGGPFTSNGQPVNISFNALTNTYTGTANGSNVFTLVLQTNGNYTFTLLDTLDHPNASNPNDQLTMQFGVTATDVDGDTANGFITVNVLDDGPIAVDDGNFANVLTPINGNVLTNDDVGSDTPGSVTVISFNGINHAVVPGVATTVNGTFGVLNISANGAYTYTANGGADGTDQFTYTIRDFDGDTATAKLTIGVDVDVNPILVDPAKEIVDETNLGPIVEAGNISANFGTDGPGTITPDGIFTSGGSKLGGNLTSDGVPVNVTATANGYVGTAGGNTVFTLAINPATGAYTFTLNGVLDHADGSNPNDVISLNFGVKATDADGDTDTTILTVDVRDDAPLAKNDVNTFDVQVSNKDLNIVLILDVSGSMQGNKLALLKSSVANLLGDFNDYTGGSIKVHIVPFASAAQTARTFTITSDADYNAALTFLNGLTADGSTNYESPMQSAINWLQGGTSNDPIAGADTFTYFVSDGEPNRYVNTSGTSVDGTADRAMQEITGTAPGDSVSEVNLLKSLSDEVIGVGIGVSATTITRLNIIDSDGHALDVKDPNDLDAALQSTNPLIGIATGNVITGVNGGAGAADDLSNDIDNTVTVVSFNGTNVTVHPVNGADINGANGTLHINADGSYTYTLFNPPAHAPVDGVIGDVFSYTLTDGDGDNSVATLTLQGLVPNFIVGQNVNDITGSTTPYIVGTGTGTITGGKAADILVGDAGGSSLVPQTKDFNVVLILDVSGSMAGSKIQLLKNAVNHLLSDFHNYHTGTIKVDIIPFADSAQTAGAFTVTTDGEFTNAVNFVNNLTANGFTNYEHPLQQAVNYLNSSAPIAGAETFTYFVSDGEPNRYVAGSSTSVVGTAQNVMDQITGVADGTNEVAQLQALSDQVIGVGIGVNSTTLVRLGVIDSDGHALDVHDPADLDSAFQDISPLNQLANPGGDTITGGDGNDIIFGDVLFTDTLAVANGLTTVKGAGWEVFERLEAGQGTDTTWDRTDTINYIRTHTGELSQETTSNTGDTRDGGNDTLSGGAGDDLIFGQEGHDIINGGAGNDILSGGTGDDVFLFQAISDGLDTVRDFHAGEDVLDISALLNGYDPVQDSIDQFVFKTEAGGNTTIYVDANGSGNIANATAIAVLNGVTGLNLDDITNNGQTSV